MEESSEAHMETDVSSTTEDVPEPQEVTSAHNNMEMVIVVEELKDELDFEDQICRDASLNEEKSTVEKSPKKLKESNKCVSSMEVDAPKCMQESASTPDTPQENINQDTELSISENSPQEQQVEAIDSSCKTVPSPKIDTQKKMDQENSAQIKVIPKIPEEKTSAENNETITMQKSIIKEFSVVIPEKSNDDCIIQSTEPTNEEIKSKTNHIVLPIDVTVERDVSNESQNESTAEEKEQNKSISRELKSLIKSAMESKIISECNQVKSKIRKSRTPMDSLNTSLNTSDAEKIQGVRRHSNNSQKSSCSEKSEKVGLKRSMRSQNPEFVSKVKRFLNSVAGKVQKDSDEGTDDEVAETKVNDIKKVEASPTTNSPNAKKKKVVEETNIPIIPPNKNGKPNSDLYCWRCHWDVEQVNEKTHAPMYCTACPRTYHYKCISGSERNKINDEKRWVCPECLIIMNAESSETRSPGMKKITLGRLCELLKYALERMMDLNGVEPFMNPVDRNAFPDYDKYVVHPMDLSLMKKNIEDSLYGSTEAFLADANWILHNSIIFNTLQSKLTGGARALVRSCRAEMGEIEACPECYAAAHARKPTWFTDVCSTPHILLWAKLKGFPYWPAKGMSVNSSGLVDVRFFGAHDRAWVPMKDCFLYSEKDPNNFRTKRPDILDSMQEAEEYIRNISRKYGKFVYPSFKTQLEPTKLTEQLKMMIPSFDGEIKTMHRNKLSTNASPVSAKEKSRSNSKSSKSSTHEGDVSESEDQSSTSVKTKSTDVTEESKSEIDQLNNEKDITMEIDETRQKKTYEPRKRRRSGLDEGVITIVETSSSEKRNRVDIEQITDKKTSETQEPSSSKEETLKEKEMNNKNKEEMNKEVISNEDKTDKDDQIKKRDEEPSSSTSDKASKPPIKIVFANKDNKVAIKSSKQVTPKTSTPNDKLTKSIEEVLFNNNEGKSDKAKSQKRRSSKANKSLNNSNVSKSIKATDREVKSIEKSDYISNNKDKSNVVVKSKVGNANKSVSEKMSTNTKATKSQSSKSEENNTFSIIAHTSSNTVVVSGNDIGRLPLISNVMSLSTIAQNACTTTSKTTSGSNKTLEITIEASPNSSIFTPTSTDNVKTAKDAQSKLQKLKNNTESIVGRVGVRSFARMKSPEPQKSDPIQSEIKSEPIDLDDAERHMEKIDLMKAFELRPVNMTPPNLREVRINKMVVTPLNNPKQNKPEVRPKAKKSFPQPKKPDEGRSELNSKNSMVYIPIQPPIAQPPIRPSKPVVNGPVSIASKPASAAKTSHVNSLANSQTPLGSAPTLTSGPVTSTLTNVQSAGQVATIGQVPATVHTVPLMTSVNGQWMLSLQPVMSVGAVDSSPSSPVVNGIVERTNVTPGLLPLSANTAAMAAGGALVASNITAPTATNSTTNKTNENTPGEPPRLQQRPPLVNPLDANAPVPTTIPPPSSAGPLTAKLNQNAVKLTEFFRNLIEDTLDKLDDPSSSATSLKIQLEQSKWRHQQEINELKHNLELTVAEMRATFDKEMARAVSDARRVAQIELDLAVKQAKSKQWCANCSQEAQFYCCWNTSYCDYGCQRAHWAQHFSVCAQQRSQDCNSDGSEPLESRLQPQPDNLPALQKKVTAAPAGGKVATSRGFDHGPPPVHKPAIIVSMMEDSSGNQSVKCVGTYKPPSTTPMIINKQIMNKEEGNKKVVTSGGYLIVGGGSPNSSTVVTPSRRTQPTIQYVQTS